MRLEQVVRLGEADDGSEAGEPLAAFPRTDDRLINAECVGNLLLRIPGGLSAGFEFGGQPRGQRGTGMLCTICLCLSSFQIP